jgi:hypothetical protein
MLALVALTALMFGCAEIYGLGDYTEADGALPDAAGGDSSVESGSPGWSVVAYDQASRAGCQAGYGTPTDVEEGLSAPPATCGCACQPLPPTCAAQLVTSGSNNGCNNATSQNGSNDGGCSTLSTQIQTFNESISVTVTAGGACTANPSVNAPSATYTYEGRLCQLLDSSGSCDAGACAPSAPYQACVYQTGVLACPAGYPHQHSVGTQLDDTRGCTSCTCDSTAGTCGGSAMFSGGACMGVGQVMVPADGACHGVPNEMFKSFSYTSHPTNGTCAPSSPTPTGNVAFASMATVCCP